MILRPLADTIVIMPPLCISADSLEHLMSTIARCIDEVIPALGASPSDGLE